MLIYDFKENKIIDVFELSVDVHIKTRTYTNMFDPIELKIIVASPNSVNWAANWTGDCLWKSGRSEDSSKYKRDLHLQDRGIALYGCIVKSYSHNNGYDRTELIINVDHFENMKDDKLYRSFYRDYIIDEILK